jgi:hypothetical protein
MNYDAISLKTKRTLGGFVSMEQMKEVWDYLRSNRKFEYSFQSPILLTLKN